MKDVVDCVVCELGIFDVVIVNVLVVACVLDGARRLCWYGCLCRVLRVRVGLRVLCVVGVGLGVVYGCVCGFFLFCWVVVCVVRGVRFECDRFVCFRFCGALHRCGDGGVCVWF